MKRIIYGGRSQGKTWRSLMLERGAGNTKIIVEHAIAHARTGKLVIFGVHHQNFTNYITSMIAWLAPQEFSRYTHNVLRHSKTDGEIRIEPCNIPKHLYDQKLRGLSKDTLILYDHTVLERRDCLY